MAENLVGFTIEGSPGQELFFEQPEPATAFSRGEEPRVVRASFGKSDVVERTESSLEEALRRVKPAAEIILEQFRSLSSEVHQVQIEFGLKFTAGVGAVIAAASTEGHCVVTLTLVRGPQGASGNFGDS